MIKIMDDNYDGEEEWEVYDEKTERQNNTATNEFIRHAISQKH
jgi:hypothetical protein